MKCNILFFANNLHISRLNLFKITLNRIWIKSNVNFFPGDLILFYDFYQVISWLFPVSKYWYKKKENILSPNIINGNVEGTKSLHSCVCEKWARLKNKIIVQMKCLQSAILKIKWTCLKRSNCNSKPKTTARDERQLNRILISSRFANCRKISKVCNHAGVAVSRSTTRTLHQLGYDSRIPFSKPRQTFR